MEGCTVPSAYHGPETTTSMSDASPTLGVGNVSMAPLEHAFTQAPNTDALADPLEPSVPASSESQKVSIAPVAEGDFLLAFGNLPPEAWALFEKISKDAPSPNQSL